MSRKNLHQSKTQPHARLGFHPECPICRRDRLFGALSPDPAVSLRVRALLATGVLALSAGLTSTSVAYEPDQQQEGLVPPGTPSTDLGPPGVYDPDTDDVGAGEDTALTDVLDSDPPTVGVTGDPDADAGPVEIEPTDDPAYPDPSADSTTPPPAPAPSETAPQPAPPATSQDGPLPTDHTWLGADEVTLRGRLADPKSRKSDGGVRQQAVSPTAPAATGSAGVTGTSVSAARTAGNVPVAPRIDNNTYRVQPSDSLWSIATRVLAPDAGGAAIAREVRRLWRLNAARIGTGDPNLLVVGVVLRLR